MIEIAIIESDGQYYVAEIYWPPSSIEPDLNLAVRIDSNWEDITKDEAERILDNSGDVSNLSDKDCWCTVKNFSEGEW